MKRWKCTAVSGDETRWPAGAQVRSPQGHVWLEFEPNKESFVGCLATTIPVTLVVFATSRVGLIYLIQTTRTARWRWPQRAMLRAQNGPTFRNGTRIELMLSSLPRRRLNSLRPLIRKRPVSRCGRRLVDDWRGTGPAGRRLAVISGRPRQGEVVTGTVRLAREAGVDTTPVPHLGHEEICHAKSNCGISRPKRSAIASPAFCKLIIRIWPPSGNTHPLSDRGGCIDGTFCQSDDYAVHRQGLRL